MRVRNVRENSYARKLKLIRMIACTCLPHQVFAHSIQIFGSVFFVFFSDISGVYFSAHSKVLIIMFALWHTANCALMCFMLLHHSIRVPNLMLILNLKSTLKQAAALLLHENLSPWIVLPLLIFKCDFPFWTFRKD